MLFSVAPNFIIYCPAIVHVWITKPPFTAFKKYEVLLKSYLTVRRSFVGILIRKESCASVYNDLFSGVQFWFIARLMLSIIIFWSYGRYSLRTYFHTGIRKYFKEFFLQFPRTFGEVNLQFIKHLRCIEHRFPSWFPYRLSSLSPLFLYFIAAKGFS